MKKNILKIPPSVNKKLETLQGQDIVAGCAVQYTADALRDGALAHLKVELRDSGLHVPEHIVPSASQGRFSYRNIHGHEKVRDDLPVQVLHHPVETPSWGVTYRTHTVWLPHKAYPKDFYPPRVNAITLHCSDTSAACSSFAIAARVNEVLSPASPDFDKHLLENLNLLQENFGTCGIEPADTSVDEYTRTLRLSWDILPPGSREEAIQRLFRGRRPTQEQQEVAESRYDFFQSLNPRQIIIGSSEFRRYFGAKLEDNLVVFENIQYGNAVYVMYENWEVLSQLSRLQLLTGRLGEQFDRVEHRDGWQRKVRLFVDAKRENGGRQGTLF